METTQSKTALSVNSGSEHVLEFFNKHTRRARQICDLLEAMADDLPRRSAVVWREANTQCLSVLPKHLALGADAIVPLLLQCSQNILDRREVLMRLRLDYIDLSERLIDLDDLFHDALATGHHRIDAEALGFALRNHFEALRKHINWECDVLWPMALRVLDPADLSAATKA